MWPKTKQCTFLNNMHDTLQLLDELLAHDSGSKIFFPLARLYKKQGNTSRAIDIVRKGLEFHPDYLEAQLFLIELLHDVGAYAEAETIARDIHAKLAAYGKFWTSLRSSFSRSEQADLMTASFVFEQATTDQVVDLFALLRSGISHYLDTTTHFNAIVHEPENDLDAEEVAQLCINSGIKTKTMAKLLFTQGEYAQALRLYDELINICADSTERAELISLRTHVRHASGTHDAPESDRSTKLYHVLNSLAARLEQKAAS
jgi:tetratricopeptide (TPR) repeat protein